MREEDKIKAKKVAKMINSQDKKRSSRKTSPPSVSCRGVLRFFAQFCGDNCQLVAAKF